MEIGFGMTLYVSDLDRVLPTAPEDRQESPLVSRLDHAEPSVFRPENMLREARRQKSLRSDRVPPICVLDPDGDIVRHVVHHCGAKRSLSWACYHTDLWQWQHGGQNFGIVGQAVGGSFAVLVAEQLFVSGCELVISIASAGQICPNGPPPYYVLIDRALRDEGTSYHYLPPSRYAFANPDLIAIASAAVDGLGLAVHRGASWTTDAPFRETAETIASRQLEGIMTVEMEAAALYGFASACKRPIVCVANVTNQLGCVEGDFEKGEDEGAQTSLDIISAIGSGWLATSSSDLAHIDAC